MAERIIVTGINGFVGEHIARTFKDAGYSVTGVGNSPEPNEKVSGELDEYLNCNLLDESAVKKISLVGARAIIHLAGLSAVGQSFDQPRRYITENSLMTFNLLDHAAQSEKKLRTVVISSGALYDPNQPLPISEDSSTSPSSPYAVSKLDTEQVAHYFKNRGSDTVVARPFNHIGPGQEGGFLLPDLYTGLLEAKDSGVLKVGNIQTKRDYTDVRDIANGYKLLALAPELAHRVYNLCSGRSLSGEKLLSLLQEDMGITDITIDVDQSKIRPTDIADIYGDSSRIRNELDWKPRFDIETTVADFVRSRQ